MKRNLIANVTENSRNSSALLILSLPAFPTHGFTPGCCSPCGDSASSRLQDEPCFSGWRPLQWAHLACFGSCISRPVRESPFTWREREREVIPKKKIKDCNQAGWPAVPVHQRRWQNHSTLLEFRDLERLTNTLAAWHCSLTCRAALLVVWPQPPLGTNVPRTQGLQKSLWVPYLRTSSHIVRAMKLMRRASQRVSSFLNYKKGFFESYYSFCILLMGTLQMTSTDYYLEEMDLFPCTPLFPSYLERIDSGKIDTPPLDR